MVLIKLWASLPTMLKFSIVVVWPVVLEWSCIWEGAFWCSLNLSPNVLEDYPMHSSSHFTLSHFISVYDSTFPKDEIFTLGSHQEAFDGLASSEVHLFPMFVAYFLQTLTQPFSIRNNHIRSLVVCSVASWVVGASSVVILDRSFESPCWVPAPCQHVVQMFFLQELRAGTNSSGPVV